MAGKVSSDPNVFLLPDIGEGLQEAELIRWLVKEGDTVEEQQSLAEVETDKALTEIPSPRAGTIKTLHGKDGDTMKVGEPFVTFVAEGESASTPAASPDRPAGQQPQPEAAQRQDEGTVVGKMSDQVPGLTRVQGKALATPAVRRKAREMGIDINQVPGTGIGGRVLEKDLLAFAASGGAAKGQASPSAGAEARQPAAGTRRAEPAGTTRRPLGGPRPPARRGCNAQAARQPAHRRPGASRRQPPLRSQPRVRGCSRPPPARCRWA
ncbi:MAG: hypothetical protein KatS3mg103_1375 [Phycisphaerales bacterium]|nr:MAG: hypothetical protein KatS3mg103_1375 [Phycisphaerales bacterium]